MTVNEMILIKWEEITYVLFASAGGRCTYVETLCHRIMITIKII